MTRRREERGKNVVGQNESEGRRLREKQDANEHM